MNPLVLILIIASFLAVLFTWAFNTLQGERWQFLATVPLRKGDGAAWDGLNLTYYGFFCATATGVGAAIFLLLLQSLQVSFVSTLILAGVLLLTGTVAARAVARIVEKKMHTFTVSGAFFAGFLVTPIVLFALSTFSPSRALPVIPVLAALMISYAIAESIGRLACISFGCCYGKRVIDMPAWGQKLLKRFSFTFRGETKKIAYEAGWKDVSVVPIQAITSLVYAGAGLLGLYLFFIEQFAAAFLVTTIVTIGWRFVSEMLRADYRGQGKISKYQWFSLIAIGLGIGFTFVFDNGSAISPDVNMGLNGLWNPMVLLLLQALWIGIFLYMGRSSITGSSISFHVHKDLV